MTVHDRPRADTKRPDNLSGPARGLAMLGDRASGDHGSSLRCTRFVRVPFKDGRPEGYYENFATGFWA